MPPAIELRAASAGYPGQVVLRDIDLVIRAGERVAVMGRAGAGKTTLLNVLYQRTAERVALIPQGGGAGETALGLPQCLYGPARPLLDVA